MTNDDIDSKNSLTPKADNVDWDNAPKVQPKKVPETKGEKMYHYLIGGSTYLTTFGASLASAYFFKYHPTGQKFLEPIETKLIKTLEKNPALGGTEPLKRAHNIVEISSLMAGGTIPVVPFKMFEDSRIGIIQRYNDEHGTGINDPELEAKAQERIENLPIQSWSSALTGRGTAMGLTLALGFPKVPGAAIKEGQMWTTNKLYQSPLSIGKKIRPKEASKPIHEVDTPPAQQNKAFAIDENFVTDATWSAFTSAVLLGGSRLSTKIFGKDKEEQEVPSAANIITAQHDGRIDSTEQSQLPQK